LGKQVDRLRESKQELEHKASIKLKRKQKHNR
jgi:hypothetical protein